MIRYSGPLIQFCWHFGSQNDNSSAWKISVSKTRRFYFGGYALAPTNNHNFLPFLDALQITRTLVTIGCTISKSLHKIYLIFSKNWISFQLPSIEERKASGLFIGTKIDVTKQILTYLQLFYNVFHNVVNTISKFCRNLKKPIWGIWNGKFTKTVS